jgi:translation initiation factor 1
MPGGQGRPGWALVRPCPKCGGHGDACRCAKVATKPKDARPTIRMRIEKRSGKSVTVLAATLVQEAALRALASDLKTRLAAGGTLKGAEIELQGDHRERLRELLREQGFLVKG